MSEFNPDKDEWSDDNLIDYELYSASDEERMISDAGARVIANKYKGSESETPAIHVFVETGVLQTPAVLYEINKLWESAVEPYQQSRLEELGRYAAERESITTVQGWNQLWLRSPDQDQEPSDRCPSCHTHVSEPHTPGCPLALYDYKSRQERHDEAVETFLEKEDRSKEMQLALGAWMTIEPTPVTAKEVAARLGSFADHYFGFFKDIRAYAAYIKEHARDEVEYNEWAVSHHWVMTAEGIYVFRGLSYPQD